MDSTFPIFRTEVTLPGRAAGVRAGGLDVSARPTGEGLVAVGEAVFGLGRMLFERRLRKEEAEAKIAAKRRTMQDGRSITTARSFVKKAKNENIAFRITNADTSTWEPDQQARLDTAWQEIERLDFSEDAKVSMRGEFDADSKVIMSEALVAATKREVVDTNEAIEGHVVDAVESGNPILIKAATATFIHAYTADKAEKRAIFRTLSEEGLKRRRVKEKDAVLAGAMALKDIDGAIDLDAAFEFIDKSKIPATEKPALISAINTRYQQERAIKGREQEALVENLHQEFWSDLRQDNLTVLQAKVDVSALPITGMGGKQWWANLISSRTKEIEKNLEVKTNGIERGNLLTEVYNISIGVTAKRAFQQKLLESRYQKRLLNDTTFDSLWLKSETEFKSWRAAQLQKSLRAIRSQIITVDESTMERMIGILRGEALEQLETRRQGEEDKYAEAVKEMDDWLAANPEPTRDDFYKEQRRLLRDYRNKSAEQIRQGRAEFKEIQTTQPTEEQLRMQGAATNDVDERKRIYEQGRELGYWK